MISNVKLITKALYQVVCVGVYFSEDHYANSFYLPVYLFIMFFISIGLPSPFFGEKLSIVC